MHTNAIIKKIKDIAQEYKEKGYEVFVEPSIGQMNTFPLHLNNYRPDLVAMKDGDNVIIEVKSSEDKSSFKNLEDIANRINEYDNWRFELVLTNSKNDNIAFSGNSIIDDNTIKERLYTVKELSRKNSLTSAFLLAWSALEGELRKKYFNINKEDKIKTTSIANLIKHAYSLGVISHSSLMNLQTLTNKKNNLIHGFEVEISKEDITNIIDCIELSMGISPFTKIYDWLDYVDLKNYNEIYYLYKSVEEVSDTYLFETVLTNEKYLVKASYLPDRLELKNNEERNKMLKILFHEYMDDMDAESFYGYNYALEND